jgi:hypothetical protein
MARKRKPTARRHKTTSDKAVTVNALGEHIKVMPDGTRHRVHHESTIRNKIIATKDDNRAKLAGNKAVRVRRINHKAARQEAMGWPADKSPISRVTRL